MPHVYYNDQSYIAEQFMFVDNHTTQLSQLAIHKINSLKLSAIHAAFCYNRQELYSILCKEGFFEQGEKLN